VERIGARRNRRGAHATVRAWSAKEMARCSPGRPAEIPRAMRANAMPVTLPRRLAAGSRPTCLPLPGDVSLPRARTRDARVHAGPREPRSLVDSRGGSDARHAVDGPQRGDQPQRTRNGAHRLDAGDDPCRSRRHRVLLPGGAEIDVRIHYRKILEGRRQDDDGPSRLVCTSQTQPRQRVARDGVAPTLAHGDVQCVLDDDCAGCRCHPRSGNVERHDWISRGRGGWTLYSMLLRMRNMTHCT